MMLKGWEGALTPPRAYGDCRGMGGSVFSLAGGGTKRRVTAPVPATVRVRVRVRGVIRACSG